MRIFFVTDLHGSDLCFRKFVNAAKVYEADVLILGGDVCGKHVVPVLAAEGRHRADLFGEELVASSPQELDELLRRVRDAAAYPYPCTAEEWEAIVADDEALDELFVKLSVESVGRWVELAEERLAGSGVRCLIGAGNDDPVAIDAVLNGSDFVENPDWRVVDLDGFSLLTVCDANPTPWDSPRELSEEEYGRRLGELAASVADHSRSIFNLHVPPYDSTLDTAPEIDAELRVQYAGGEPRMVPVGSTAVREGIERFQPLLGLHGHVHESQGTARLGRSLCINPGSTYEQGRLDGVIVELSRRKGVKGYQFTSG
ncbi:MAG: metallophosphoesterase [Actinobacteria bacterium]|nr:metallophosphoesterase [Actinomycetota bacterium]